ncbi:hypothetical protein EBZ39_00450 [bacterium]|nr:hypothetical protein [bacterium]
MADITDRITDYLASGGFFNPEHMEHEKVRALLVDCRDVIETLRRGSSAALRRIAEQDAAIRRLADQDATLSVCGGDVIVQMDFPLSDAERRAVERAASLIRDTVANDSDEAMSDYIALRGLYERAGVNNG